MCLEEFKAFSYFDYAPQGCYKNSVIRSVVSTGGRRSFQSHIYQWGNVGTNKIRGGLEKGADPPLPPPSRWKWLFFLLFLL